MASRPRSSQSRVLTATYCRSDARKNGSLESWRWHECRTYTIPRQSEKHATNTARGVGLNLELRKIRKSARCAESYRKLGHCTSRTDSISFDDDIARG